ncbi:GntR family transcriptional regulator [Nonomuraea sp. NPDC051941]|uniref:GntR family transcriptional regulator n=1 Tax=Nonomuraea sp. NPDC051941 TaxID=3364373 RepID=UPI0037C93360
MSTPAHRRPPHRCETGIQRGRPAARTPAPDAGQQAGHAVGRLPQGRLVSARGRNPCPRHCHVRIAASIRASIRAGRLRAGTSLPPTRTLAAGFGVWGHDDPTRHHHLCRDGSRKPPGIGSLAAARAGVNAPPMCTGCAPARPPDPRLPGWRTSVTVP